MSEEKAKRHPFRVLHDVDMKQYRQSYEAKGKKGNKFTVNYLSWANALRLLMTHYPEATWGWKEYEGLPYLEPEKGPAGMFFVGAWVEIEGVRHDVTHPVTDRSFTPIVEPHGRNIADARMRAFVKACAFHGLGLALWEKDDIANRHERERGTTPRRSTPSAESPREEESTAYGTCPKCGSALRRKDGSKGPFLGCQGYPKCKFTRNIDTPPAPPAEPPPEDNQDALRLTLRKLVKQVKDEGHTVAGIEDAFKRDNRDLHEATQNPEEADVLILKGLLEPPF